MPAFIKKSHSEILIQALDSVVKKTPITARSPGSVARSIVESITTEIGDLYSVLDYNISQSLISTASSTALDKIGELYGIRRNTLSASSAVSERSGAFYFYIDTPYEQNITIPSGTRVYSNMDGYVGSQLYFDTTSVVVLPAGRTKVFAPLSASLGMTQKTASPGTLTRHSAASPAGVTLRCTNPKVVAPVPGYESDENYRLRISKQLRVNSGGTTEALRFAILTVPGVRDVMINSAPYGLGTVEILVIPKQGAMTATIRRDVQNMVDISRPLGTRMIIVSPETVAFDITMNIVLNRSIAATEEVSLKMRAEYEIKNYLNSLLPDETLVYNRLIQHVMDLSELISDVTISTYAADGIQLSRGNYVPKYRGQVIPGNIVASIAKG